MSWTPIHETLFIISMCQWHCEGKWGHYSNLYYSVRKPLITKISQVRHPIATMRWTLHKTTFAVALWLIHQQLSARTTITATALAPPMSSDWESVSAYRKRLNITTFKYQPEHLSAHHCKYLAEKECQRQDEAIRDALKSPRRQLVAAPNMGESITVLVVLCRFSDHKDRLVPSRDHFDKLFNGGVESDGSDPNKVGSVKKWLYYSSMGKYKGGYNDESFDRSRSINLMHHLALLNISVRGLSLIFFSLSL